MPEQEDRAELAKVIREWNDSRLDLFEISPPDEVSRLQTPEPPQHSLYFKMSIACL